MEQGNKINLQEFPNTMMIAKRYNASTRETVVLSMLFNKILTWPQERILSAGKK